MLNDTDAAAGVISLALCY